MDFCRHIRLNLLVFSPAGGMHQEFKLHDHSSFICTTTSVFSCNFHAGLVNTKKIPPDTLSTIKPGCKPLLTQFFRQKHACGFFFSQVRLCMVFSGILRYEQNQALCVECHWIPCGVWRTSSQRNIYSGAGPRLAKISAWKHCHEIQEGNLCQENWSLESAHLPGTRTAQHPSCLLEKLLTCLQISCPPFLCGCLGKTGKETHVPT